jgi:hypothetical protein
LADGDNHPRKWGSRDLTTLTDQNNQEEEEEEEFLGYTLVKVHDH